MISSMFNKGKRGEVQGGGTVLILRNRMYCQKSKQSILLCQQIIPTALEAIKDAEYEGTYIRPVSVISKIIYFKLFKSLDHQRSLWSLFD